MSDEHIMGLIEPQPPQGIKYMLGEESWLPKDEQAPRRLHCEEWGNLGPMELNPEIKLNKAGFRVRVTEFLAPHGAHTFFIKDEKYYWSSLTDKKKWDMEISNG